MHDGVISNNVVYSANIGLQIFEEAATCDSLISSGNQVLHNTFADLGTGVYLERSTSCTGAIDTLVRDNVIYNFSTGEFRGWRSTHTGPPIPAAPGSTTT